MCVRDRKREGECEADVEGKIVCETEKERERELLKFDGNTLRVRRRRKLLRISIDFC